MRRRFLFNKNVEKSLVITANEPSTVAFAAYALGTCEYNLNNTEWVKYTSSTTHSLNAGETISFRGDLIISSTALDKGVGRFSIDGNVDLYGSPIYLLAGQFLKECAFESLFAKCDVRNVSSTFLPSTTLAKYCYYSMFEGCTNLTTAPELPATTLADYCYITMFKNCTNLTTAPKLPATTLTNNCYGSMFSGCTSLTTVPELPVTTLAEYCYSGMFRRCTSLTTAPELPATILADGCYRSMFEGCTNLTTAPELPATILADGCYQYMFYNCTSLTIAPELPATTLAEDCYGYMFNGCTKLNYIKMLATDKSASDCLYNWVDSVSRTGTFVKNPGMTTLQTGSNGIPSGWTVVNDGEESGGNAIPNNQIHYTSIDNAIVYPYYKTGFGANIVSNTNENGLGIITFDGDITTFESYVYAEVEDLTSITIPNSVTLIEINAFEWCTQLTSVTIGEGVTKIKNGAFYCCRSLSSVYCKAKTPPSIERMAFGNNASGRKIYVPMESVDAYRAANGWIDYANDIVGYNF